MKSRRCQVSVQCKLVRMTVAIWIVGLAGCGAPEPWITDQQTTVRASNRPLPVPGAYRVSRGDTLYSIAFRYGLDWRNVARWNGISAPYVIHAGDWIRLQPRPAMRSAVVVAGNSDPANDKGSSEAEPASRPDSAAGSRPAAAAGAGAREKSAADGPARRGPSESDAAEETASEPETRQQPREQSAEAPPDRASGPSRSVAGVTWRWPASGRITRQFDASAARKGILIAGEDGQSIRAAADGQVVYSGNGLIGYGELVIIKHSDRMLSAYAHNRERLVAEGDRIRSGEVIARMGNNERAETVLHFEIRRDGKPANPLDYLPSR